MKVLLPERLPPRLGALVRALPDDPWNAAFRDEGRGHGRPRDIAYRVLRRVVSDFDADGWLGTHPMALLGEVSWRDLIGQRRRMLDVGAGSGDVTVHARSCVGEIVTTEISVPMARRLRKRGFVCHRVDLAREVPADLGSFDVVSLLNVLDRCDRPRSLLKRALSLLEPEGVIVFAVPLPARPHLDVGGATVDPDEPLGGDGDTFEDALVDLVEETLEPCGVRVERLARAAYLSRGHLGEIHELDDAIIVGSRG